MTIADALIRFRNEVQNVCFEGNPILSITLSKMAYDMLEHELSKMITYANDKDITHHMKVVDIAILRSNQS